MALESKNSAVLVVTRLPAAIRAREVTAANARRTAREASMPFLNLAMPTRSQSQSQTPSRTSSWRGHGTPDRLHPGHLRVVVS